MDQIGKDVGQKLQKLEGEGGALIWCFELKGRVSEFVDPLALSDGGTVHHFCDSPLKGWWQGFEVVLMMIIITWM